MADDYYQSYLDNRGMSASTFSGTDNQPVKRTRKDKFRDAVDAASKFKSTTDYKARKEAKEKEPILLKWANYDEWRRFKRIS